MAADSRLHLLQGADVGDRLIAVDAVNRGRDRTLQRLRLDPRADDGADEERRALLHRDVDARPDRAVERARSFVGDDADDLPRDFRAELRTSRHDLLNQQTLADRILIGEVTRRERLVDDRNWRSALDVAIAQRPALQ